MNQFINQPVVNWARQTLPQTVEVKLKQHKILLAICLAFLGLIFLTLPVIIFFGALGSLIKKGWNSQDASAVVGSTVFMGIFALIALGLFLLIRFTRRRFARYFSHEGVQTRGGQRYGWGDLYYLDYKKVRNARVSAGGAGLAGRVVSGVAANAAQSAIFAGHEKVTVELVFANGKAVVPPLIVDQAQILGLLSSMPVQRRTDGTVNQA